MSALASRVRKLEAARGAGCVSKFAHLSDEELEDRIVAELVNGGVPSDEARAWLRANYPLLAQDVVVAQDRVQTIAAEPVVRAEPVAAPTVAEPAAAVTEPTPAPPFFPAPLPRALH